MADKGRRGGKLLKKKKKKKKKEKKRKINIKETKVRKRLESQKKAWNTAKERECEKERGEAA